VLKNEKDMSQDKLQLAAFAGTANAEINNDTSKSVLAVKQ
jgi:hypothetical protein